MKLWIDDRRTPPKKEKGWTWVKNWPEAREALLNTEEPIRVISFDHDLGTLIDGYDIIKRISWEMPEKYPMEVRVHSANPVGKVNIQQYDQWYRRMLREAS